MEAKSVLSGLILGWFFALWLGARLVDVNVPIITVPSDRLRNSIDTSGQYCPYSLTVEQYWRKGPKEHISIEGGKGTIFLFREKVATVIKYSRDAAAVVQWFLQQIRVDHLLIEVFLCEHIWVTVLGAAAAWAMARLLVFDPFIIMRNVPVEYVAEMRSNENAYISNMMRKFVMEKVLVLAYVIVRNPDKDQMVIATRDAKMPTTFDWAHRITDATVFAIWFILVWSVTAVTLVANQRFEMIVGFKAWKKKPVESDNDTKVQSRRRR